MSISKGDVKSWASPNEHLMFFDYSSWWLVNMKSRWQSYLRMKKTILQSTKSPWWSPQYQLLTFFTLRNNNNELTENWTWTKKGDDFGVLNGTPSEPFGRDLDSLKSH
eukprot:TRINITY_DN8716_c0_g1_i2.p1 TRINITY_DN8716_c0_g1~~TRINITY_DN8716_c0_g1_i2.p1  ORF type:complete len:108 (-),score=13.86 TRINITY_DN8716_c0_g1_i2:18-341(-)